ncbi:MULTISPECIES: hypothetical protein [Staphylococcus]|uniref:hypothetical protein n=1 Tax=Staphylococcus TaxID=1279 RepID=UPI000F81E832|nr:MULTISPECIES: hypothetical protein [Staphylococcus]QGS46168.1 hypothetical protein FOB90_05480 [Mammaliicoccus fleurettii]MBF1993676.1 hypothetical protein [Staphylococcus schleiferi]MBF2107636.1 hypothetical protein [Staphylococcus schleiferi]MBF2111922.1 hypothetical protein [Staphylococcus schleiferi]MBF2127948.1 hypothetical protein [Staphylococcus schleiferi]
MTSLSIYHIDDEHDAEESEDVMDEQNISVCHPKFDIVYMCDCAHAKKLDMALIVEKRWISIDDSLSENEDDIN